MRTSLDASIEIGVPASAAYEFWTSIEDFPRFLGAVESVERIDAQRSRWRVSFGLRPAEWTAEVTEVIPGKRRSWRAVEGLENAGMVNFHPLPEDRCLMTLHVDYEPRGLVQNLGDELGVVQRAIQRALEQFKDFAEAGYS
jgi:uncharacterized membrane protein